MAQSWKTAYSSDEVEWTVCPMCGLSESVKLAEEWSLGIVRCSSCRLIYVNPRLKNSDKNYWGVEEQTEDKYGPIFDGLKSHNRDENYLEHLRSIKAFKPTGRLLDVGTHCGFFLRMARGMGWELYGIEPSPTSSKLAREKFGLHVHTGYLDNGVFPPSYFDVVTLVDVFEHVAMPLDLLGNVRKILKDDGIIFLKVPNAEWNLLKYKLLVETLRLRTFDIFDSREHVIHYSQYTLEKMLNRAGLAIERFYVPRPIQTGSWWQKLARSTAWLLARVEFLLLGKLGSFATDIAAVAVKIS